MDKQYLLGIDIGTQSARAVIFNLGGGIIGSSSIEYSISCPRPGWAEQNPQVWWESTVSNIKSVMGKANITGKAIAAVGVCEPDRQNSPTYDRLFKVFQDLHDSVQIHFQRLAKINL